MYQRIQASKKKEGGFTLIELLIVVVILGILAAVVIFASAGFANKGALEACKTTVTSVKTANEAFHVDSATAVFPTTWAQISPLYFDDNGVTPSAPVAGVITVTGKGWKFGVSLVAATGPTFSSGGGAAFTPTADPYCTK